MKKHFVIFLSPGAFIHEATEQPVNSWDVVTAARMAHRIKERHGATPFGFYFITRERGKKDLDSRETKRSGTYYLGGVLLNADDIKNRTDGDYSILLSNMACNNWPTVIENKNSWKIVQPFRKGDTLLDWKPKQLTREENLEGKS